MNIITRRLLLLALTLGAFLRIWGINFGLPFIYHADEPIVVNHAMAYGVGDFNPHFFAIPPLASYYLFFLYGVYFFVGKALHLFTTADSFALSFLRDPSAFYMIGRLFLGTLPGIATIYAIYIFGKKLFSAKTGILSALFLSVSFIHVQNSHYTYVDILMVLFIVFTCISSIDVMSSNKAKCYILAGVFAGISAAIKYNAAIVFITVIVAHFMNNERKHTGRLIMSFCVMAIIFTVLNPYAFLDAGNFINAISKQAGAENVPGVFYHLRYSLLEGLGIGLLVLGAVGMLYYGLKEPKKYLALISFPVLFYLVLCFFSQPHERYTLPLVPFFIVYAAAIISEKIRNRYLIILLVTVVIMPNAVKSVYSDVLFTRDDTRTVAKRWIENNIKDGSKIAIEHSFFCPRMNQDKEQIEDKFALIKEPAGARDKRLRLALKVADTKRPSYRLFYLKDDYHKNTGFLFEKPNIGFTIPELRKNKIEYVIVHIGAKSAMRDDFYRKILDNAVLIKEFSPYKNKNKQFAEDVIMQTGGPFFGPELFSRERNGYIIKVFKLKEA